MLKDGLRRRAIWKYWGRCRRHTNENSSSKVAWFLWSRYKK